MRQLSPTDSQMLFVETPETPNILGPMLIYDPSTAPGGKVTYKGILKNIEDRLDLAPSFRRKLVRVPLDLDEPYWVDDPHFDLEYHVRHLALPKPGDWRQLCILMSRLVARQMDPTRPLWEMNVIEGLDNIEGVPKGCFAILFKIHHAMIDGKAGVELINILHDLEPNPPMSATTESEPWVPETSPTPWKLTQKALKNMMFKPGHSLRVAARTMPSLVSNRNTRKTKVPFRVPKTPFNEHVTATRVVDSCFLRLDDFKAIRKLVPGSTINDVAIAVISGGLRKYLLAKKQLPRESLVASVPISVRTEGKSEGNELIIQSAPICTQISDPLERLQKVVEIMQDTKGYVEAVGAKTLAELSTAIPGRVGGLIAHSMNRLAEISGDTLATNTLITNVPGAQVPLYMTGAKVVRQCGAGPLASHMGLSNFIGSYCGEVQINFTACRDLMPDPELYTASLQASFDQYMDLVKSQQSENTDNSRTTKKRAPK